MGASASAAYTLRKNYTKLILPFECHFDRGGIDPQPIIASLESTSKKNKKNAASVPSPAGTLLLPAFGREKVAVISFPKCTNLHPILESYVPSSIPRCALYRAKRSDIYFIMKCTGSFAGSSNSQDSFPAGPSGGAMDNYSGYNYPNEYGSQRGPPNMPSNQGKYCTFVGLQFETGLNVFC